MTDTERQQLIDDLIEGQISEADFLRLEAELSVSAPARREYYQRLSLSTLLEAEAETAPAPEETPEAQDKVVGLPDMIRTSLSVLAMAAALTGLLFLGDLFLGGSSPTPGDEAQQEAQDSGFAIVAGQAQAQWQPGLSLEDGALLPTGPVQLQSGLVQLDLFSGVTVIIEGPAEFEIQSPMSMSIAQGKVRARVPDSAHQFRVHTASGNLVDLGTEFALNVSSTESEVHVFDGAVEWHPESQAMRRMAKGEALRWDKKGLGTALPADTDRFVGPNELRSRLNQQRTTRQQDWLKFTDKLRQDPRLVAYYRMTTTNQWSRRLPNLAPPGPGSAGEGAIVATARATDRWGDSHGALDFSPTGSRVRLNVPGTCRSLTLMCWVRINSLDRMYNSLFLTDGHEQGEPHWQIRDDGRLFFSVKKRDTWDASKGEKDKHIYYSPSFWNASLIGQWLMIATVYDVDRRQVTHYLNGRPLSQEAIPSEYLVEEVRMGNASLGNWGLPERDDPHFAIRNLNGSMNEFALFKAALSPEEIASLHERGRP